MAAEWPGEEEGGGWSWVSEGPGEAYFSDVFSELGLWSKLLVGQS